MQQAAVEATDLSHLRPLIQSEAIVPLVRVLFGRSLTPGQAEIAGAIAFPRPSTTGVGSRVAVVAPTQYGKTQAFADGFCTRLCLDRRPIITKVIGPREEQARIFRDRVAKNIIGQPLLADKLDLPGGGVERIKKEVSQRRFTFTDGKELSVHSAHGDADRVMGEGGDIVVKDEACLIENDAHAKVGRMLAANPDAELYEMANPWHRDSVFFQHWSDPGWRRIFVPLEQAVKEGRLSQAFVDEQRKELAPTMFQVLYESQFPDVAEDQLIPWSWVVRAKRTGSWRPPEPADGEDSEWTEETGADIAEGGMDKTVLTWGWKGPGARLHATRWRSWQIADTMRTADTIHEEADGLVVNLDENGVGKGVADRLRQKSHEVRGFKGGRKPKKPERFFNTASEALWELRRAFEEERIELYDPPQALLADLTKWRWLLVGDKIRVEVKGGKGGGNSPDHGDSLAILNYVAVGSRPKARGMKGPSILG